MGDHKCWYILHGYKCWYILPIFRKCQN